MSVLNLDRESIENISRSLVDSHHRYCVWKFMIIPESIVQITDIYSKETVNRLLQESEEFLLGINQIDIVGQLKTVRFDKFEIFREKVSFVILDISN